ncbi:MAG TPA: hypothetical protein DDW83_05300 [Peptococcaceae bacterium]|nr:hypothetical protein [Peptococcaceae bacterium]
MMVSKRKVLLAVVLVIIIAGAGAGVVVAVKTPFFQDIKETVFAQQHQEREPSAVEQALIKENEELRERVAKLEQELSSMTHSEDEAEDTEPNTGLALGFEVQKEVYKKLAQYYDNMKPDAAVAILNNHAPQLVAGILHEMEKDQAGEILSRLDPEQAAELIELIARQASLEGEQNNH